MECDFREVLAMQETKREFFVSLWIYSRHTRSVFVRFLIFKEQGEHVQIPGFVRARYRGTLLIRKRPPPGITMGPYAYSYGRVLWGRIFL